ncbi:MAG: DUF3052 family protein [Bacteroidota bacterium]
MEFTKLSGYSGTPLVKKLGFKPGFIIGLVNEPVYYFDLLIDIPAAVQFVKDENIKKDLIHFFTRQEGELLEVLPLLKQQIKSNGMIWVSWPKKASKVTTDVTEDTIRNYAISIDLVDVKVCAVDEIWSGLKLVIPVKDR